MTDHSAPGVYTQPDGDGDDVLGHRAADRVADRAQVAEETDDVEGHRVAFDRAAQHDDEDDVEGHRIADRAQDRAF